MQTETKRVYGKPFVKGDPRAGRPKGGTDRITRDVREAAQKFVHNREYQANLRERILAGQANHLEVLLWYYAFGKPRENIAITAVDVTALQLMLVEARNGTGNGNGHYGNGSDGEEAEPVTIDVEPSKDDEG